jgi:hypothetical protein
MLIVADPEAAPGFLHASLFLFFMGLGGSVLNVNTIVPLATSGFFYVFTFFAPVPISAITYQNSFSGPIWYLTQKLSGCRYKAWFDVPTNRNL